MLGRKALEMVEPAEAAEEEEEEELYAGLWIEGNPIE